MVVAPEGRRMLRLEAQLEVGGETIGVRSGDVISVDGGQDHYFLNITEDLAVLAIFAPPDDPRA
jgi:quercetin dioxygenase-like cupin family protein